MLKNKLQNQFYISGDDDGECSVASDSLGSHRLQLMRLLCPWDHPGKSTAVSCHFLLQGILPTQVWNPCLLCLLHCRQIFFFNHWATLGGPLFPQTNNRQHKIKSIKTKSIYNSITENKIHTKKLIEGVQGLSIVNHKTVLENKVDLNAGTEKALATHSSTLAWKLPWTEEPGRLQSMGSLRVRYN